MVILCFQVICDHSSSSAERTHSLHRLEVLTRSEVLTGTVLSAHWGSAFMSSFGCFSGSRGTCHIAFHISSESSSERRDIVAVKSSLWVFGCSVVSSAGARSVSPRKLEVSLTIVGVEHGETGPRGWRSQDLVDSLESLLEVETIFFLNFEHSDEERGYFLTEVFLDEFKFIKKRV